MRHQFVTERKIRELPRGEQRVAAFATAQHGVVHLDQLQVDCGLSTATISRHVARRRLHRWAPRVFAVGHPMVPHRGRLIGALLCGGDDAVLSHLDAAEVLGLLDAHERAQVHVTVASNRRSSRRVRVHRSLVPAGERTVRQGLPLTTAARVVLDLADTSSDRLVEQVLDRAHLRRLITPEELDRTIAGGIGRRGVGRLQRAYRWHLEGLTVTRSELEEAFLALLRAGRHPRPLVNQVVLGHRADFSWPEHGLIVETDGLAVHTLPGAFERDRRRDRVHRAAGLRVERITWGDVTQRPDELDAELRSWFGARGASPISRGAQDP